MLSLLIRPLIAMLLLTLLAGYLSHFVGRARAAIDGLHPAAVVQLAEQAARRR